MKIKKYKEFHENATANASNTSGMGNVVAAQPGSLPGTTGTDGSGDVGYTFKKEKREKGDATEVTDLRDLEDVKTEKIEDINEKYNYVVEDTIIELEDLGLEHITTINGNDSILIELFKNLPERIYTGNLFIIYEFDKSGITKSRVNTLRASGKELLPDEADLVEMLEMISNELINRLDYRKGFLKLYYTSNDKKISFLSDGTKLSINIDLFE
jgi:hypothetical protein